MSASNTAGFVGKWGRTSFTALPHGSSVRSVESKFFKSRNARPRPEENSSLGGGSVGVAVRLRPALPEEVVSDGAVEAAPAVDPGEAGEVFVNFGNKAFRFDKVYGASASQEEVFDQSLKPLLADFINGIRSAAVVAYGQTGAGKTYTMGTNHGNKELSKEGYQSDGLIPRALTDIFSRLRGRDDVTVKVSFFEVYSEKIFDLIKANRFRVPLKVKEEGNEFILPDLTQEAVNNVDEALTLLVRGCETRSTAATAQNQHSSRSHAIFRITLEGMDRKPVRLSLVDLAGSESTARAETSGARRVEGVSINLGLSCFGRCVGAICRKESHVPFRDSCLTKVLRGCFVGGGETVVLVCISPNEGDLRETVNTLRYADAIKGMKKPKVPEQLLLAGEAQKSVRKRRLQVIPPTPAPRTRHNRTIATPTPSKKASRGGQSERMNLSEGYCTPVRNSGTSGRIFHLSSIKAPSLETISDESDTLANISDLSSVIEAGNTAPQCGNVSGRLDISEARSVFSPLLRKVMKEQLNEMKAAIECTIRAELEQSMLMAPSATVAKKITEPRMTSSPRRRSARLSAKSRQLDKILQSPEESLSTSQDKVHVSVPVPAAASDEEAHGPHDEPDLELTLPRKTPLRDVTNLKKAHLRRVEPTASPDLKKKSCTPVKSVEEMAAVLGLNMDSPTFCFSSTKRNLVGQAGATKPRSSRRTTMVPKELKQSLVSGASNGTMGLRRSARLSIARPALTHALEEKVFWRVPDQDQHNKKVLEILNTANMRVLQTLPGIGPKSAVSLHSYRELHGKFDNLRQLEKVRGLPKQFLKRFFERNQISLSP